MGECGRVGGVAGHHPHRNRPPDRVGEQPVLDLRQPLLAVPGVAAGRQRAVRAGHPGAGQIEQREPVNPDRLALFDLSSSWMTGSPCPVAARGYSRDGKKGLPQIEYGLLTDPVGRPVAVRVVAGNTADPTAFAHLATDVRDRFGLTDLVLAADRARNRSALLAATEADLATIAAAVQAGRLVGAGKIGIRVGKVIGRYRMAKHYTTAITDGAFAFARDQAAIDAEAALDGIYVVRTSVPAEKIGAGDIVRTYKSLAAVERDFRSLKSIDLDLRPVYHYTETRVRAHVFLCMLAAYLVWHLRQAWRPLTFTDQDRPDPVSYTHLTLPTN